MLIQINLPAIVMIFYAKILDIVRFDILEDLFQFHVLIEMIFQLDDISVNEDAESLGYGSHYILSNIGPIFIFFFILVLLYLIFIALIKFGNLGFLNKGKVISFANSWTSAFKWNGAIQFFNESYLCICISVFFNIQRKKDEDGSWGQGTSIEFSGLAISINSSLAILSGASLILVPLVNLYALKKYYCKSNDLANELKHKSYRALEPKLQELLQQVRKDEVTWAQICVYHYQ